MLPKDFNIEKLVIKDITTSSIKEKSGITFERIPIRYNYKTGEDYLYLFSPRLHSKFGIQATNKGSWTNYQLAFSIGKENPEQAEFIKVMDQITEALKRHLMIIRPKQRGKAENLKWVWVSGKDTEEKNALMFVKLLTNYIKPENAGAPTIIKSRFIDENLVRNDIPTEMKLIKPSVLEKTSCAMHAELRIDHLSLNSYTMHYSLGDARVVETAQESNDIMKYDLTRHHDNTGEVFF